MASKLLTRLRGEDGEKMGVTRAGARGKGWRKKLEEERKKLEEAGGG